MFTTTLMSFVLMAAFATAAVVNDAKMTTEKSAKTPAASSNGTASRDFVVNTTPETATAKSAFAPDSEVDEDGGGTGGTLHKRTIEQTVGYGYRYNTVLRPIASSNGAGPGMTGLRGRAAAYQRGIPAVGLSSTPPSYYFQQNLQNTTPKTAHRFSGPYIAYPRTLIRQDPSETRPVTESPLPMPAPIQQHQDLYREVYAYDDEAPQQYHLAARTEQQPLITPHALFIAPAGHSHALAGQQQVIPVLILRLDTHPPFPYSMMAMQILRDETAKLYSSPADASVTSVHMAPQYSPIDPSPSEAPSIAYYTTPEPHQTYTEKARRVGPPQPERYRNSQNEQLSAMAKVGPGQSRRPTGASGGDVGASQGPRTEVTIHHSPGMTAQDYKESIEEQEEA